MAFSFVHGSLQEAVKYRNLIGMLLIFIVCSFITLLFLFQTQHSVEIPERRKVHRQEHFKFAMAEP